MLVLTVVMIPVLIAPIVLHHLDPGVTGALVTADYFIWGIFLLEYLIRLVLAPRRRHFVVHNIPDLIVVAVPMLRPLQIVRSVRVLRLLRLSRLTAVAGVGAEKSKRSLHARATNYVLLVMGSLILISSVVVLDLERDSKAANIKSIGDALWWSVSTVTTVGYGDRYPVTAAGRAVAVILMIGGIALLGVITASIAAYFVEQNRGRGKATNPEVEILVRLTAIEEALVRLGAMPLSANPKTPDQAD